ncbi:MAG: protein translocase subunit SecF [Actinomycetes bacterium]
MARESFGARLYRGDISYDIVGRQRLWYIISGVLIAVSVIALLVRGLTLGIEFRGGSEFQLSAPGVSVEKARAAIADAGVPGEPIIQVVGGNTVRIQTESLTTARSEQVKETLAKDFKVKPAAVSQRVVGPSWGQQITGKAVNGLIVFLVAVVIFIWAYFREWRMGVAAILALAHDLIITVGIYALVGFEVTPSTVIGLLTILGYSLYDTVVVFDKVRENTNGITSGSRATYTDQANLAVNQTLVRSINTSVIALLPVAGILFVGAGLLGAGTLKDLSLALFIGIAVGTYSSIFIATPVLADLKEREPAIRALRKRVEMRRAQAAAAPAPAAAGVGGSTGGRRSTAVLDRPETDPNDAAAPDAVAGRPAVGGTGGSGAGSSGATRGPRNQPRRGNRSSRPSGKRR